MRSGNDASVAAATRELRSAQSRYDATKRAASELMHSVNPSADTGDANFVFLTFVIQNLPVGLVGMVLAAIFCAAMSACASGLNSLASTTTIDIYKRLIAPDAEDHHAVHVSRGLTIFWGVFSIGFAEFASRLGSLIEAVNRLGSLFYGTILAIFLLAFYTRHVSGTAAFIGAVIGQMAVALCAMFTDLAWLWWNVVGCAVGVGAALLIQLVLPERAPSSGTDVAPLPAPAGRGTAKRG